MPEAPNDFYVGWQERAPAPVAARVRVAVIVLFCLVAILVPTLWLAQSRFGPGEFEFGVERSFIGIVREAPHPVLLVPRPLGGSRPTGFSRYLLVGSGKFGAADAVQGLDGRLVELRGSLIYRGEQKMIEIVTGSVGPIVDESAEALPDGPAPHGAQVRLVGEIVDAKCYLGVMKPGSLKAHKSCAIRCLSGGVPPLFLVRDAEGGSLALLLVAAEGRLPGAEILQHVAEPVEISGELILDQDLSIFRADFSTLSTPIRRPAQMTSRATR